MEGKLQSLEQRRKLQLLKLMYYQSKIGENIKVATRPTRAGGKIVFNIPSKCTTKYLNSPYYIGVQLWNKLGGDVQRLESIMQFERNIMPLYKTYQDPNM